ncbi:MAG: hypothetical protein K6L74_00465 [Neptuniibacter sp.]
MFTNITLKSKLPRLIKSSAAILVLMMSFGSADARVMLFSSVTNGEPFLSLGRKVLTEAYKCVGGIEIEVQTFPAKRALYFANHGYADGELIRPKLVGNFDNLRRIDVPLFSYELVAVSKLHTKMPGSTVQDFKGEIVGIIRGFQSTKHIPEALNNVVLAHDGEHLLKLLQNDRIDYAFMMKEAAAQTITKFDLSELKILTPSLDVKWFYHYLHRKNWHLIPKLEHCLKEVTLNTDTVEKVD